MWTEENGQCSEIYLNLIYGSSEIGQVDPSKNKEKPTWKQSELLKNPLSWICICDPGQNIWNKLK